jgi:hypothetical protein
LLGWKGFNVDGYEKLALLKAREYAEEKEGANYLPYKQLQDVIEKLEAFLYGTLKLTVEEASQFTAKLYNLRNVFYE